MRRASAKTALVEEQEQDPDDSLVQYIPKKAVLSSPSSAIDSSPIIRGLGRGVKKGRKSEKSVIDLSSDVDMEEEEVPETEPEESDDDDDEPLARRRPLVEIEDTTLDSSPFVSPHPSKSRSTTLPSSKSKKSKGKGKRPVYDRNNAFVAMEADLSGDDVEGGSTDTEGEENEYDRDFVKDGDESGILDSDDQRAIYRQSLMTQAPDGLNFTRKPVRGGVFGANLDRALPPRRGFQLSSSPPRGSSPDEYEFGSFIVQDEDEDL